MSQKFSNIGLIFAAIGSAVGLGNIWRFPYMLGNNGGFAFLFAYIIALFLVGIPILVLELSVGERYKLNLIKTYNKINPKLKIIGILSILISACEPLRFRFANLPSTLRLKIGSHETAHGRFLRSVSCLPVQ